MRVSLRLIAVLLLLAPAARATDAVTEWTVLADRMGGGAANWRTMAIMHQAMHDAWNAALPSYARWAPPAPGEPPGSGALPQVAMAAAARRVLVSLHPGFGAMTEQVFRQALDRTTRGALEPASVALGDAIGVAAVARRAGDGFDNRHLFAKNLAPGRWRPVPDDFANSTTTEIRPFLVRSLTENPSLPPPVVGSKLYLEGLAETLRIGAAQSSIRTPDQTAAAVFWAYQSSQRGFVILATTLLDAHPRPEGLAAHARLMSQMGAAMADAAILTWSEKEKYSYWRPITAIRETMSGYADWEPLISTPGFPEYPSGHASDCFTGAFVLQQALPDFGGTVTYTAQAGQPPGDTPSMGQHSQSPKLGDGAQRDFPSLAAAAEECSNSRIWAGAHIQSANEESRRLGAWIARRAAEAVPPLR